MTNMCGYKVVFLLIFSFQRPSAKGQHKRHGISVFLLSFLTSPRGARKLGKGINYCYTVFIKCTEITLTKPHYADYRLSFRSEALKLNRQEQRAVHRENKRRLFFARYTQALLTGCSLNCMSGESAN